MNRSGRKYNQYKGLKQYLDVVTKNPKLEQLGDLVKNSPSLFNEINTFENSIKIESDWIEKIEFYLPFISSAILEGRRFILNTGETVDIEKIKRVSKDSIVDLAKHSNNIRKFNEVSQDVEPRKLLIVEKNDDFGLYENKFLVYLLLLLKSFVSMRFDKIKEAQSILEIKTTLKNNVTIFKDSISYDISIDDIRHTDLKVEENDVNKDLINRLNAITSTIEQFFKSDLISIVAKLPLISEPIQKNNVLKNDPNFVKCYELYEYLKNYNKDGFEIEKSEIKLDKLSDSYINFFKFIPTILTFLSYSESKDLFPLLEEEYINEKEDIRKLNHETLINKISEIFASESLNKEEITNIILKLEDELKNKDELLNKTKEDDLNKLHEVKKDLNRKIETLTYNYEDLNNRYEEDTKLLNNEVIKLKDEKEALKKEYEEEINKLKAINRALNIRINPEFEKEKNDEVYFNELEKDFDIFTNYFKDKWKEVKKVIKKEKKKEIRELLKKKEKING